ncbi:MAG: CvpA family protein, partial [Eubacteriales bacterium]|nr:CvpA family protein [Eubacteriales bacterium]
MVMDLITVLILLLTAFHYAKKGIVRTILGAVSWVLCITLGFRFTDNIRSWLDENTGIGVLLRQSFAAKLTGSNENSELFSSLPNLIREGIQQTEQNAVNEIAEQLTTAVLSILAFFLIVLAVKIVISLISLLFSKKHQAGAVGTVDGIIGFAAGILIGCFLILLFYALLTPGMNLMPESLAGAITE